METVTPSFASQRVTTVRLSAIKEMAMRAAKLDDVASLAWGLPSFRTPEHIRQAAADALRLDSEVGKYSLPDGLPELREAAATHYAKDTGVSVCPDDNVVVTAGNMEGMKSLLGTLLDPGDEVIVTDPGFASHFQQILLSGGEPVCWPLREDRQWSLDIEALPDLMTPRTRALIIVTPSNPTGRIFRQEELTRVAKILQSKNLLLIVDDPYSPFTYENADIFFNPASIAGFSDNLAYLFTFSKCHAMSGWRLGFAVLPAGLKQQMLKVHDSTLICAPRISQVAGLAALRQDTLHIREFEAILKRRRRLICDRLDRVPHVFSYVEPDGAYYVFPRIETEHQDARQFSLDLLHGAGVCVTPGAAFGPLGEGHVRMAFCGPDDEIDKAFDRIERRFPV